MKVVKNLHAKLYLFDGKRAVLTSANLTAAAMDSNHEFGATIGVPSVVSGCMDYFETQWAAAGPDLTRSRLAECEVLLGHVRSKGTRVLPTGLQDFGHNSLLVDSPESLSISNFSGDFDASAFIAPPSSFVKFFGEGNNRASLSLPVLNEIRSSGSHWACTSSQRHRQPVDGSVMFLSRIVSPKDFRIYGVALAQEHVPIRDSARPADILLRPWKQQWPYYVRVHRAAFIAGTLENGISLHEMMDDLEHESFASTSRNFQAGAGTTNPRETLRQAHSRELSSVAHAWLLRRFQEAIVRHGRIPEKNLAQLDWPSFDV